MSAKVAFHIEEYDPRIIAENAVADAMEAAEDAVWERLKAYVSRQRALGRLTREQAEFADDLLNCLGTCE